MCQDQQICIYYLFTTLNMAEWTLWAVSDVLRQNKQFDRKSILINASIGMISKYVQMVGIVLIITIPSEKLFTM